MAVKKLKRRKPSKLSDVVKATRIARKARPKLSLPTKKKEPDLDISHYTLLLYGREKIGKTTLLSSFPQTLFLTCEPGTKGLRIFEIIIDRWETFRDTVSLLEKDRKRYKTIAVDTADRAYQMCQEYVCKLAGVEHPHDANDYGKTWNKVKMEFLSCLDRIVKTGMGLVMTSHAREQDITTRSGANYTRIFPTLTNQARTVIEGWVNLFFFVDYMTDIKGMTRRVIVTKGDETIWAGHQEVNIPLPRFLPLKQRNGYEILQAAFHGEKVGIDPANLHVGRQTSEPGKKLLVKAKRKKGGGGAKVARRVSKG